MKKINHKISERNVTLESKFENPTKDWPAPNLISGLVYVWPGPIWKPKSKYSVLSKEFISAFARPNLTVAGSGPKLQIDTVTNDWDPTGAVNNACFVGSTDRVWLNTPDLTGFMISFIVCP